MICTVTLSGCAKLRTEVVGWLKEHHQKFAEGAPASLLVYRNWEWETLRYRPRERFREKALFRLTHLPTGANVCYNSSFTVISVSVSLARILLETNMRHLQTQGQLDEAMSRLVGLVDTLVEFRIVMNTWKFTRIDLVRPLKLPFSCFKRLTRGVRLPVYQDEPVIHKNSVLYQGTGRQVFAYDKEKKELRRSEYLGERFTRLEVRLMKSYLKNHTEVYETLVLPGLRISLEGAVAIYLGMVSLFPSEYPRPDKTPARFEMIARLALCEVTEDGHPVDVIGWFINCIYSPVRGEAARRARKAINAIMARTRKVQLKSRIIWTPDGHEPFGGPIPE